MLLNDHVVEVSEVHFKTLQLGLMTSQNSTARHSVDIGGMTFDIVIPLTGLYMCVILMEAWKQRLCFERDGQSN